MYLNIYSNNRKNINMVKNHSHRYLNPFQQRLNQFWQSVTLWGIFEKISFLFLVSEWNDHLLSTVAESTDLVWNSDAQFRIQDKPWWLKKSRRFLFPDPSGTINIFIFCLLLFQVFFSIFFEAIKLMRGRKEERNLWYKNLRSNNKRLYLEILPII